MKKVFTFFLITAFAIGNLQAAPGDTITLDLSLPLNPASFTYTPAGYWTETYNEDDYLMIDFDNFSFSHAAFSDYNYWYGFTVCTSGDNANYIGAYGWDYTHQWGNMAGGGIKTDASGAVLKDDNGKPQVEQGIPYMLAYADSPTAAQTIIYGADEPYQAVGVYVNISPWAYYGNIAGDGFAEGLTAEGDYFKLLIHALDEDYEDNGKVVEHYFAKFENGALTQSPDWEWVDLSPLGKVYGLSYTLESTDANSYGMRTAAYFALDKLQVCKEAPTPVEELVTVGASETTVAGLMLGGYYGFERHAALYTHAELANANWQEITSAKISSLAFKLGAVTAPNDNREIKIYLKEVTDAELAASMFSDWATFTASATLVYSQTGTDISLTANAWNEFEFTAPFQYGGGNLLVITDTKANSLTGGTNCAVYCADAANKHWHARKDTSPLSNDATGEVNARRADITLTLSNITGTQLLCPKPTGLSALTINSATTLSWQDATDAEEYTVEYKVATQDWTEATVIAGITGSSATFAVTPETAYQARVKKHCGDVNGDSDYSDEYLFTTPCQAVAVGEQWAEDFTEIENYAIPDCWTKTLPYNASATAIYPAVANVTAGGFGKVIRFQGNQTQIIAMPPFVEEVNVLQIAFKLYREDPVKSGTFELGVLMDPGNADSFVVVEDVTALFAATSGGQTINPTITLSAAPTGYHCIAFRQSNPVSSYYYYLDNIVVAPAVPVAEFSFEVADLTATFTDESTGEPTAWEWDFGDGESSAEQNPVHTYADYGTYQVTLTATNATGESEPVTKTVWLAASNDNYATITVGTGTTTSRNLNLGGYWGFERHATLYTNEEIVNPEWLTITGGDISKLAFQLANVVAPNDNREIKIYLKEVTETELATSMFSDWAALTASATLVYSQTGTDISLTANAWNEFEFTAPFQYGGGNLLVITDTKANYTNGGSDAYLYYTSAVKRHWMSNKDTTPPANNATGDLNDRRANIQFSLANIIGVQATCIKPTELSVVADAYSADISWVGTANAASYTVEYKTETQNWEDATVIDQVSQTSATLTVVPATSYQVRVKTFCGETDGYSDYSDVYSFRTPCIATAVGSGFTEDFTTIADYAIPDCWTKTLPHNASSIAVYPAVVSNATYGQFVRFYGVAPQALAMPEFEEDINTLALTFDLWRESAAQSGIFEVGVLSDPTNPATFVSLQNVSSQITVADKVYATYTVSLTDAPSGYNYIAFRQSGTTTAYFYQLDNIVVAPAVPVPVAEFSFEVADLTATFTDESTGEPTAWEWDFGDGETSAEQNPVHTYAVSGTYQVTLTVTNATGESEPVTKTVQVIVSNINNVFAKEVNIYPNPAKDCISLSVSGMEGNISLKITDLSGKTLMTKQFTVNNNIVEKVDISVLKQGIYFISVENKDFSKTQKLTVY